VSLLLVCRYNRHSTAERCFAEYSHIRRAFVYKNHKIKKQGRAPACHFALP
jgi:hypothetical protein